MSETFDSLGLNPTLVSALNKENITIPYEIQQKVIIEALKRKDIIARSGTGTGKTLAYLLPLFEKLNPVLNEMQAIILCPTHELAVQIMRQTERLSQNSDLKYNAAVIVGNVNIDRQIEKLKERPQIIVGTAGRILELIKKRKISAHTVKTIILDEADRMMDEHNAEPVRAIIKSTLRERQMMAFSATMPEAVEICLRQLMKEPEVIRAKEELAVPKTIEHYYFIAEKRDKIEVLRKLAGILKPERAIVFVSNQGNEIEIYTDKLKYRGINAAAIHGATRKLDRKKALEDFRAGKLQLLIASDIAARGLHIEGITHIFNVHIPEDVRDYVHRTGRSGRNGASGIVISIATERELNYIKQFEKLLSIPISPKAMYRGAVTDARAASRNK